MTETVGRSNTGGVVGPPDFVEVSPRDGLQNEETLLKTADKIELIHQLVEAGARRLEVASFVHPVVSD